MSGRKARAVKGNKVRALKKFSRTVEKTKVYKVKPGLDTLPAAFDRATKWCSKNGCSHRVVVDIVFDLDPEGVYYCTRDLCAPSNASYVVDGNGGAVIVRLEGERLEHYLRTGEDLEIAKVIQARRDTYEEICKVKQNWVFKKPTVYAPHVETAIRLGGRIPPEWLKEIVEP